MALTRLQLRTQVRNNIGGRTDKDSIINTALDLGLEQIGLRHDFRKEFLETDLTLAAAARSVTIPTTEDQLWEVRRVDKTNQDGFPIDILSKRQFVEKYPTPEYETTGEPKEGYVENGVLYFDRPADVGITIRITTTQLPAALTADTSTPVLVGISYTLVCWATQYLFSHLEQFQESRVWEEKYERALRDAIMNDKRQVARTPIHQRVAGRPSLPSQYWLIWDIVGVRG